MGTIKICSLLFKTGLVNESWFLFRSEIVSYQYNFGRDQLEADEIKTITKAEVLAFYDAFISAGSGTRRKIACHVISTIEENGASPEIQNGSPKPEIENGSPKPEIKENGISPKENGVSELEEAVNGIVIDEPVKTGPEPVLIDDAVAFKNSHSLWPLGKPFRDPKTLVRTDIANSA